MFKIQDNFDLKSLSCRSKICDKFKEKTKTIWVKKHIKFIKSRPRKEAIKQKWRLNSSHFIFGLTIQWKCQRMNVRKQKYFLGTIMTLWPVN